MINTHLHILGGNNHKRIGASCQLIEHIDESGQKTQIMFDLGLLSTPEISKQIFSSPDILHYLGHVKLKTKSVLDGLFITHTHKDHIGGLLYLAHLGYIFPPIYASPATIEILKALTQNNNGAKNLTFIPITTPIKINKNVIVTPFPVTHSAIGTYGFHTLTKVDNKNHAGILHMSDFTLTPSIIGDGYTPETFKKFLSHKFITHTLIDSTYSRKTSKNKITFQDIQKNYESVLEQFNNKRIITGLSAQNTQIFASIIKACQRMGRKMFIDGFTHRLIYKALQNLRILSKFKNTIYNHNRIEVSNLHQFTKNIKTENQFIILSNTTVQNAVYPLNYHTLAPDFKIEMNDSFKNKISLDEKSALIIADRIICHNGNTAPDLTNTFESHITKTKKSNLLIYNSVPLLLSGHANAPEIIDILDDIYVYRQNKQDSLHVIPIHGNIKQLSETENILLNTKFTPFLVQNGENIAIKQNTTLKTNTKAKKKWIAFERIQNNQDDVNFTLNASIYQENILDDDIIFKKLKHLDIKPINPVKITTSKTKIKQQKHISSYQNA